MKAITDVSDDLNTLFGTWKGTKFKIHSETNMLEVLVENMGASGLSLPPNMLTHLAEVAKDYKVILTVDGYMRSSLAPEYLHNEDFVLDVVPFRALGAVDYADPMNNGLAKHLHHGWLYLLKEEFHQDYMKKINIFLRKRRERGVQVYPQHEDIFRALRTDPMDIRVVILGQDPYHNGHAHGLAFSTWDSVTPASLKNIQKEIQDDIYDGLSMAVDNNLTYLARQGVLLLNTVLTVEKGQPLSHQAIGWQKFTGRVINIISQAPQSVVFMLWGRHAKEAYEKFAGQEQGKPNLVLTATHPSPLSAYKGREPFLGCQHFSKANKFLEKQHQKPIRW